MSQLQQKKKTPVSYAYSFVPSEVTRKQYKRRLKLFFDHVGMEDLGLKERKEMTKEEKEAIIDENVNAQGQTFLDNSRQDSEYASQQIMEYLVYQRERVIKKQIAAGTLKQLWKPIKTFTSAFPDVSKNIDWRRIARAMPRARMYSNDRVPTIEEFRKLVEFPDRRIKALVYTMCSSGIRIGAWEFLKWKHVEPIKDQKTGEIIAAKLTVYAGEENEEYVTFCTPEAYLALKDYMDFRAMYGEQITGDSWVIRNNFKIADVKRIPGQRNPRGGNTGTVSKPKKMVTKAINRLLIRALYEQGLRESLEEGKHRHEFKTAHSMRKWFKTRAEQVMNRLNVEFLMGHSIGLNSNYYRPTTEELMQDYAKAVPLLTINDTNVESLRQQFQDKEKEIENTKMQIEMLTQEQAKMREMIASSMRTMSSLFKLFPSIDHKNETVPSGKVLDWAKNMRHMLNVFTEDDEPLK
jgi:integrase